MKDEILDADFQHINPSKNISDDVILKIDAVRKEANKTVRYIAMGRFALFLLSFSVLLIPIRYFTGFYDSIDMILISIASVVYVICFVASEKQPKRYLQIAFYCYFVMRFDFTFDTIDVTVPKLLLSYALPFSFMFYMYMGFKSVDKIDGYLKELLDLGMPYETASELQQFNQIPPNWHENND